MYQTKATKEPLKATRVMLLFFINSIFGIYGRNMELDLRNDINK